MYLAGYNAPDAAAVPPGNGFSLQLHEQNVASITP